jgi:Ca2+-binding RTX toxin-like protein
MALTATQSKSMYQFFALAFNAAPGVTYMNQLDAAINSGMSVTEVVEQFTTKAEFTSTYPNFLSNEAFATKFITNNVGSNASAAAIAEAIADVTAALNAGWSRGKTITQVFTNITNLSETDATWGNVVKSVNNKVAYAQYYTETLLGGTEATPSLAALRAVIANVTPTTSVATADMAAVLNPAPVPVAQTFTLTTGVDSGTTFTGGAAADAFNADLSTAGGNTLNALDRLNGGDGADTLTAVLATDVTPASITSIESIVVSGTVAARTLGLTNATGVTSVTSSGSAGGTMTVTGIAAGANLAVQSQAVGADFQFATTTGTQSTNLSVAAVTGAATITIDGVETIAVTASGSASTYQLAADAVTTLSFAGSSNQTVTLADMTGVSNFDASAATGNVNITLINQSALLSTADVTVSGGAGNDTITVSAHTQSDISVNGGLGDDTIIHTGIVAADTVNGGDGTDILSTNTTQANVLDAATPTTYTITSIETLSISDQTATSTLTTQNIATSINKVVLANSATNDFITGGAVTVVGGAGSFTLDLGSANAANTARVLGDALTVTDTGSATTDSVSIVNRSTVTATGLALDVFAGRDITSTGYESVSINTGAASGGDRQDITTLTITPDSTSAAVSLTLAGANNIDIGGSLTTTSTALMTVNASGLTAQAAGTRTLDINTTSQGTGGTASITGSAGDDSIVVGNFASTVIGGAGNDTLTGGTAADNLQGGDGIDLINDGGGNDTISGGAGNDIITITGTSSVNVDAGDGDDTVNMNAVLSSGDVVNGGAGNDTLAIDAAATAESSQGVTNFEFLLADTALTQDMVQFTTNAGFTRLISNVAGSVTFNNVGATTTELRAISTGANTLTFDRLLDNTTNAVTIGTFTDADTTIATLVANDEETINIVAGGATTAGRAFQITTMTAADLVTLNVSGATAFTTTIGETATALATVNASANTGAVVISATNATSAVTMTGSATAASTLTGGTGADVITGGSGADVLNGGANADTIDGGSGADTINGGSGADSLTGGEGIDSITGGLGNDTIVLTETTAVADRVIMANTAANNGTDAIIGFTAGATGDVLVIDAFLDATAMNAKLTANPGGATTVDGDVNLLVDIVDGNDITTAAGLTAALAVGGEYANIDVTDAAVAVFVTAANSNAGTQYVFYATAAAGVVTASLVGTISGVDIDNFVAANFNIA